MSARGGEMQEADAIQSGDESANSDQLAPGLARIQRQLMPPAGSVPMQGYLLKRSETLRKWNQRWFTLDPSSAKMEYRVQRSDPFPRGLLVFEADSTITVSPLNFHGAKQYEGCNFYIGGSSRKEYFLCAETPGAARAWVSTLRAAALVLKAHREAVQAIGEAQGSKKARAGAVAAATAMANAASREAAKEIAAANQRTVLGAHHLLLSSTEAPMDNVTIMKETLRVKDEELQQLASDLRSREATINDLAQRLSDTAQAAEAAANAAHRMDSERSSARAEVEKVHRETEARLNKAANLVKAAQEREVHAVAIRNDALQEVQRLRSDLAAALKRIEELQIVASQAKSQASECEERARKAEAEKTAVILESQRWQAEASRLKSERSGGRDENCRGNLHEDVPSKPNTFADSITANPAFETSIAESIAAAEAPVSGDADSQPEPFADLISLSLEILAVESLQRPQSASVLSDKDRDLATLLTSDGLDLKAGTPDSTSQQQSNQADTLSVQENSVSAIVSTENEAEVSTVSSVK